MPYVRLRCLGIVVALVIAATLPMMIAAPVHAACTPGTNGCPRKSAPPPGSSRPATTIRPGSHSRTGEAVPQASGPIPPAAVSISGQGAAQFRLAALLQLSAPAAPFPTGSAYDPVNHSVYIADGDSLNLSVYAIDAFSLAVTRITDPSLCFSTGVAVNTHTGEVYVNNQSGICLGQIDNTVTVISPANQVTNVIPISPGGELGPTKIAVDSGRNLIYSAENDFGLSSVGDVVMIDGNSKSVVTRFTAPAGGFVGVAVDEATGLVFASNNLVGSGFPNTLMEINPFTQSIVNANIPTGVSPAGLADAEGKLYLATGANLGPNPSIQIYNPEQPSIMTTIPVPINDTDDPQNNDAGLSNIAVSQTGSLVYADSSDDGILAAVDPFSGTTLAQITFGTGEPNVSGIALAANGAVFVNIPGTSQVAVIQGPHP